MVDQHESGHRFHNGDGAGNDTGIVPAAADQFGFSAVHIDRPLRLQDGRSRLERDAEDDFLAIADAALRAAAAIRRGVNPPLARFETIVVLTAAQARPSKTTTELETLRRRQ